MAQPKQQQNPEKEQYWQELILRQQSSGQTIREVCVEEGVSEASFFAWRAELAKRKRGADPSISPTLGVVSQQGGVEILLGDPTRVRVSAGFDPQTLRDVLAILEELSRSPSPNPT